MKPHLQRLFFQQSILDGVDSSHTTCEMMGETLLIPAARSVRPISSIICFCLYKHIPICTLSSCRAEPILQRIKEDRTRVVSPSFDNIKYDTFEIEEYPLSAQGFDWELWCRYLNPPKSWWTQHNNTAPIR